MTVQVVSIHDASPNGQVLSVDLVDILAALGDVVDDLKWCVLAIEAVGPGAAAIHGNLDSAQGRLWVSGTELRAMAAQITQTIDGVVVAFPLGLEPETLSDADLDLAQFPSNRMVLAISAVDSSYFEVFAKDRSWTDRLVAAFRDVRKEDAAAYF
jgi:hypothetical protein